MWSGGRLPWRRPPLRRLPCGLAKDQCGFDKGALRQLAETGCICEHCGAEKLGFGDECEWEMTEGAFQGASMVVTLPASQMGRRSCCWTHLQMKLSPVTYPSLESSMS